MSEPVIKHTPGPRMTQDIAKHETLVYKRRDMKTIDHMRTISKVSLPTRISEPRSIHAQIDLINIVQYCLKSY